MHGSQIILLYTLNLHSAVSQNWKAATKNNTNLTKTILQGAEQEQKIPE